MNNIDNTEYISFSKISILFSNWKSFLFSSKYYIIAISTIGLFIGLAASYIVRPQYKATLSFAVQEPDKGGGLSGLASQFGFSVGSSSGAFGGENLYELLKSRFLIEKTLLLPVTINGKDNNLLNLYISTYGIDERCRKSENEELRKLVFPLKQSRETFSRTQDSVFQIVCAGVTKNLVAVKRNKKLSIGDVTYSSENEVLSKLFVENLMKETTDFYVEAKTKLGRTNYLKLLNQADSIKVEYERAVAARAGLADQTVNSVRQSSTVGLIKKQTEIQILAGTYIEMKKNLELMKVNLDKEVPLIQIIDKPIFPLEKTKLGKIKSAFIGVVVAGFLSIFIFSGLFGYRMIRRSSK